MREPLIPPLIVAALLACTGLNGCGLGYKVKASQGDSAAGVLNQWTRHESNRWCAAANRQVLGGFPGSAPANYNDVAYGEGIGFVAVREDGVVALSSDSLDWCLSFSGFPNISPARVAYGGNTFVAVGRMIITSGDGLRWTSAASPVGDELLLGLAYGGDKFVAVGFRGSIITSGDGRNWAAASSPVRNALLATAHGAGTFMAVGQGGSLLSSSDGRNWNFRSLGPLGLHDASSVVWGNNLWVVGGDSAVMRSTDGETWTRVDLPIRGVVYKLVFGNNTFVALVRNRVLTSTDASTWTERAMAGQQAVLRWVPHDLYGGTYAQGRFVLSGVNHALITNP